MSRRSAGARNRSSSHRFRPSKFLQCNVPRPGHRSLRASALNSSPKDRKCKSRGMRRRLSPVPRGASASPLHTRLLQPSQQNASNLAPGGSGRIGNPAQEGSGER
jgi:hypothetical protein